MTVRMQGASKLGVGIYTVADAARLLRRPPSTIRRWLDGYSYELSSGSTRRAAALVRRSGEVTFLDLAELLVIGALRDDLHLTMKSVRRAAEFLAEKYSDLVHPLASQRLETDGRDLYLRLTDPSSEAEDVVNLSKKGQGAFKEVVERYLRQLDFDEDSTLAERWWPMGRSSPVVVDPRIAFGSPHIAGTGIQTRVLWGAVRAGDDPSDVAAWFGVDEKQVRAATRFEDALHQQAA